jgi:hypothetical protein
MSVFHNTAEGERMAARAHKSMKYASFGSAICALAVFGLSVASVLWHAQGERDHRENEKRLR